MARFLEILPCSRVRLKWERQHLAVQRADIDTLRVRRGGGEKMSGRETVLPRRLACRRVECGERAVHAADKDISAAERAGRVIDDRPGRRLPLLCPGRGIEAENLSGPRQRGIEE